MKSTMSTIIYVFFMVFIGVVAFAGGIYFKKLTIAETEMYVLKKTFEIKIMGKDEAGVIPANTVIYKFKDMPEISTYFMFLNTKYIDQLVPYTQEKKFNLIIPVSAYPKE